MTRKHRQPWQAIVVATAAAALTALAAFAAGAPGNPSGTFAVDRGQLTAQQTAQLERIRGDLESRTVPLERELEAARMELDAAMAAPNPDPARIRALRKKVRNLEDRLDDAWLEASERASKILTPDQRSRIGDPRALLMGDGAWYDGWYCPWDRPGAWTAGAHMWDRCRWRAGRAWSRAWNGRCW